jgi:hypothetical protein
MASALVPMRGGAGCGGTAVRLHTSDPNVTVSVMAKVGDVAVATSHVCDPEGGMASRGR